MDFEALVKAKFDEAYAASEHPKKFFLTENGRGVVDGGEMYNALLHDVLDVVQRAMGTRGCVRAKMCQVKCGMHQCLLKSRI